MNSGHFHSRTATVTLRLDVRPMFSHQVFSIKGRLMDPFSLCIVCLGSVKTICREWELSPATVHSIGGEEMTVRPPKVHLGADELRQVIMSSIPGVFNQRALQSRLSHWSRLPAVTSGDKSNGVHTATMASSGLEGWTDIQVVSLFSCLFPLTCMSGTKGVVWIPGSPGWTSTYITVTFSLLAESSVHGILCLFCCGTFWGHHIVNRKSFQTRPWCS